MVGIRGGLENGRRGETRNLCLGLCLLHWLCFLSYSNFHWTVLGSHPIRQPPLWSLFLLDSISNISFLYSFSNRNGNGFLLLQCSGSPCLGNPGCSLSAFLSSVQSVSHIQFSLFRIPRVLCFPP